MFAMNANEAMLTELVTAQSGSMVEDCAPNAPPEAASTSSSRQSLAMTGQPCLNASARAGSRELVHRAQRIRARTGPP
jgi:hypothetical protein